MEQPQQTRDDMVGGEEGERGKNDEGESEREDGGYGDGEHSSQVANTEAAAEEIAEEMKLAHPLVSSQALFLCKDIPCRPPPLPPYLPL